MFHFNKAWLTLDRDQKRFSDRLGSSVGWGLRTTTCLSFRDLLLTADIPFDVLSDTFGAKIDL